MSDLLTSLDIVNQNFKKSLRGYDAAEVDEFLDHVAETLQNYNQKNKELERELAAKNDSLAEYDRMKDVLHEALLMAQKSADDRVKSARAQAEKIIEDARSEASDILGKAENELNGLRMNIAQVKDVRERFAQEFRSMLAKFDMQLGQTLNSSQMAAAAEKFIDEIGGPEAEEEADEGEPIPESKVASKDFAAAFDLLGVDPKELNGDN